MLMSCFYDLQDVTEVELHSLQPNTHYTAQIQAISYWGQNRLKSSRAHLSFITAAANSKNSAREIWFDFLHTKKDLLECLESSSYETFELILILLGAKAQRACSPYCICQLDIQIVMNSNCTKFGVSKLLTQDLVNSVTTSSKMYYSKGFNF